MSAPKQHVWGNPDYSTGARACNRHGCTVRVRDAYREWQPKPGTLWRSQFKVLIPECTGSDIPMAEPKQPAPLSGQVEEDEQRVQRHLYPPCRPPCERATCRGCEPRAALSRLAAAAQEREALLADNAALVKALDTAVGLLEDTLSEGVNAHFARHVNAHVADFMTLVEQPHPGAALLKDLKKKEEAIRAAGDALWAVWTRAEEIATSMPGGRTALDLAVMESTVPIHSATTLAEIRDALRLLGRLP